MLQHSQPAKLVCFVFILATQIHVLLSQHHTDHKQVLSMHVDDTSGLTHLSPHHDHSLFRGQNMGMHSSLLGHEMERAQLPQVGERSSVLVERLCDVRGEKSTCYEDGAAKCTCIGGLADCSGRKFVPNLSYAPKFPPQIKCLRFKYNDVQHLDNSFFANVSNFLVIDFSNNNLHNVSNKTFERFTHLKYLILNYNLISYETLKNVLDYPPALRLDLVSNHLEEIPKDYFRPYWHISLSQLYMDYNYLPDLHLQELSVLRYLEYLSLTNCNVNNVVSATMPALKFLYLDHNNIVTFPATCTSQGPMSELSHRNTENVTQILDRPTPPSSKISNFPSLTGLDMSANNLAALPSHTDICLPRLIVLQMESNNISQIPDNVFTSLRSLKMLNMDKMRFGITKVGSAPFSSQNLAALYLSKNKINFSSDNISSSIFEGCSHLKVLQIDHNFFSNITEAKLSRILSHLPNVETLYLGSCGIKTIPVVAFAQMTRLKRLYIYLNSIDTIPSGAFDKMSSLQYLYMDENKLSTVGSEAFSQATRLRLKQINLSKNQFQCDCDLLWFQSWLNSSGPDLFMDTNNYMCSNMPGTHVQLFELNKQACIFSRQVYILFVVCLSILITVFIVFAIFYRYRWNIRLMLYERRAPAREEANEGEQHHRYDLFIVYCNDDADFVEGPMLKRIERQWGLRICIHQRDFVAGGHIIDNIVGAMNSSKRILVVVSSRFVHSKWCNLELQLCQSHVIDHDLPSLLVVKLDEIESRDMSAAMYALYNTTCFLELPSDLSNAEAMSNFWTRLKAMLKTLIPPDRHLTRVKIVEENQSHSYHSSHL